MVQWPLVVAVLSPALASSQGWDGACFVTETTAHLEILLEVDEDPETINHSVIEK